MLKIKLIFIITILFGCVKPIGRYNQIEKQNNFENIEVLKLIQKVLVWSDTSKSFDLFPIKKSDKNIEFEGIDSSRLRQNQMELLKTDLFSNEFVNQYTNVVAELDLRLKKLSNSGEGWEIIDLPPIFIGNGGSPWCNCQDNLNWDQIVVTKLSKNKFIWKWDVKEPTRHQTWIDFKYEFEVVIENNRLKIKSMEGFIIR